VNTQIVFALYTIVKKNPKQLLEKKCDSLCTPVVKVIHPFCEACGQPTQVAHHFIERSRSNRLRYDLNNLIGLCNSCHVKIHNRFGNSISGCLDIADIIRNKRGEDWYQKLKITAREIVKTDISWYEKNLSELEESLQVNQGI
jgi:hypothetical protein